jgi:two-component system sensor histidine kinase RegB
MLQAKLTSSDNAINLYRLIWLRFIVIGGESAAVIYGVTSLQLALPVFDLSMLLGVFTVINCLTLVRFRLPYTISDFELFGHLTFDVIALTVLLYFTGGSTNPFAPLYLLPLTLTAATLPGRYTWSMLVVTVLCYTGLFFYYVDLPQMHGAHDHGFRLHVLGMWLGFIFSALLIAGFIVQMASTVKRQNIKIADLREKQLRHEQVLALGTLAAGAAHELGTPLSTMAIMLKDMEPGSTIDELELETLREQVNRCRNILGSISASAGTTRAVSGSEVSLEKYLTEMVESWQQSRNIEAKVQINGHQPAPHIVLDQTFEQAILNILNNAADASPDEVEIKIDWDEQIFRMEVADRGSGLAPDIIDKTGNKIKSTKQNGLGLGLFLTYSTFERLGGKVHLLNREGGGVICRVEVPLDTMLILSNHDRI